MKQAKTYIVLINDHSGSMGTIAKAAMKDYNSNIDAITTSATEEKLDTIVSVIGIGSNGNYSVERQVVISNPHVLLPKTDWPCPGGTPLYDAIVNGIELMDSVPDIEEPHVSVLFMVTTDGYDQRSQKHTLGSAAALIQERQKTDRWTFVFRIPKGGTDMITPLGVPKGNIQEWETTAAGMAATTAVNQTAMRNFMSQQTTGKKGSSSFYVDASNVNVAALTEVDPKEISLYVVPDEFNGKWIRDFILTKRQKYLKGAAFFQLTKTEPKVQHDKMVLVRDRATGKFFGGREARDMIGLPHGQNARLHPGDHKNFDIFIQSKSLNRHLVAGTGVAYYEKVGTEFTQADFDLVEPKPVLPKTSAPAPVQLPKVLPTNKPTKSPLVPTPRVQTIFFDTREDARRWSRDNGKPTGDAGKGAPKGKRYYVTP